MKIYLDSIGCRLNQSEIEKIANEFRTKGHEIVAHDTEADVVIINTCTVTGKALSDSRRLIRKASRNDNTKIIATGCWATVDPEGIKDLPAAIQIVDNFNKEHLVAEFLGEPISSYEPIDRRPVPGGRFRTRAFIKAQDGCDNHCTFCVTRIARGSARSTPLNIVLEDIHRAVRGGAKESVLTGVNLGSWGFEWSPTMNLADLARAILAETDIKRLRLSSVEPWELDQSFFELWHDPRMCRQLHLPLQSGSDDVLKRMGRQTTQKTFKQLVETARTIQPEIAITTDVIVGFPGETESQFMESLNFIEEIQFADGHVFAFSPRPGTPALNIKQNNSHEVIKNRSKNMRTVFDKLNLEYRKMHLDKFVNVLWEKSELVDAGKWKLTGLSDNYIRVEAYYHENRWNEMDHVHLIECTQNGTKGELTL